MEIWKDIPNHEGCYQISSLGRVKSLARTQNRQLVSVQRGQEEAQVMVKKHSVRERILKPNLGTSGYLGVGLMKPGTGRFPYLIHRLVAKAFLSMIDGQNTVNHINGDKKDNRVENLEWVSVAQNTRHAFRTGLSDHRGVKNAGAKLNPDKVKEIRELSLTGLTQKEIGARYNVSPNCISSIICRQTWTHV